MFVWHMDVVDAVALGVMAVLLVICGIIIAASYLKNKITRFFKKSK